jgi:hypothetical protein
MVLPGVIWLWDLREETLPWLRQTGLAACQ